MECFPTLFFGFACVTIFHRHDSDRNRCIADSAVPFLGQVHCLSHSRTRNTGLGYKRHPRLVPPRGSPCFITAGSNRKQLSTSGPLQPSCFEGPIRKHAISITPSFRGQFLESAGASKHNIHNIFGLTFKSVTINKSGHHCGIVSSHGFHQEQEPSNTIAHQDGEALS